MTHLHLVPDNNDNDGHSIRADLHPIDSRRIYRQGFVAMNELKHAIEHGDVDDQIPALRRLLAVGAMAGDHARRLERGTP